jgi:hypothetical protein
MTGAECDKPSDLVMLAPQTREKNIDAAIAKIEARETLVGQRDADPAREPELISRAVKTGVRSGGPDPISWSAARDYRGLVARTWPHFLYASLSSARLLSGACSKNSFENSSTGWPRGASSSSSRSTLISARSSWSSSSGPIVSGAIKLSFGVFIRRFYARRGAPKPPARVSFEPTQRTYGAAESCCRGGGKPMLTFSPRPSAPSDSVMPAPCKIAMSRTIASPSPVPSWLVASDALER